MTVHRDATAPINLLAAVAVKCHIKFSPHEKSAPLYNTAFHQNSLIICYYHNKSLLIFIFCPQLHNFRRLKQKLVWC